MEKKFHLKIWEDHPDKEHSRQPASLSNVPYPNVVAKRLEKLQRCFLWGGGALERKAHLVEWDVICPEKRQGSLGLRKLTLLNKALLGKWIRRFASDKDCTWKTLINSKYGLEGLGWCSKEVCGPFRVGLWKEILKESNWVKQNWKFIVGNGTRIRF